MAKKVVATLRDKSKTAGMIKVIRAVKNSGTGSYSFKEDMVNSENLQEFLKTAQSK
jgi:hypothetical protein